jgi:hypothetical protein
VKNHKNANYSYIAEAGDKLRTDLESFKFFGAFMPKFKSRPFFNFISLATEFYNQTFTV